MDGYGVFAELRRHPGMCAAPFIFLTARTIQADIRHGMVHGADDYLTKPFTTDEILDTIRTHFE